MELPPEKEFNYVWDKHGFEIDIPAGAISRAVTLNIQASYSGDYQFPDNNVLVSGVYWLALDPPVKFKKKVTVRIQHCTDADSAPFFANAKCTQKTLPYEFKPLPGGEFTYPDCGDSRSTPISYGYGSIQVEHFSFFGIFGRKISYYGFCTYYLSVKKPNNYKLHITVTPNLEKYLEVQFYLYIVIGIITLTHVL